MIHTNIIHILLCAASLLLGACGGSDSPQTGGEEGGETGSGIELPGALDPVPVSKSNAMKVYAHYMPWFDTPESNGTWGWHWTMNTCNPDRQDGNGRREIASHYYPQTGPYASNDATVLNYQMLLMKYAGIDGILIDWYGVQDKNDYPAIRRNTEAVVKAVERAGLEFAIVYEDATLEHAADKVSQAQTDMAYLQSNFFNQKNYIKVDGKPLLLVFGPQQLKSSAEWNSAFSGLTARPALLTLYKQSYQVKEAATGEFLWVDPHPETYYAGAGREQTVCMGGAMPGFKDYYKEGNAGSGYTSYDAENGALFERQLQAAKDAGLRYLQVSTWNDFGEGTTIEPTLEYGYRYLTALQQFCGVSWQEQTLEEIYRWYGLKRKYASDKGDASKYLTQAFYFLIALQPDKAAKLMDEL